MSIFNNATILYFCLKEQRDLLRNFEIQKNDLNNALKNKRADLQKIRDDIEAEDEVLQVP